VVEALVNRKTVMDYPCNGVQKIVLNMWREVEVILNLERTQPMDKDASLFK